MSRRMPTIREIEEETAMSQARALIAKAGGKKMLAMREWITRRMKVPKP